MTAVKFDPVAARVAAVKLRSQEVLYTGGFSDGDLSCFCTTGAYLAARGINPSNFPSGIFIGEEIDALHEAVRPVFEARGLPLPEDQEARFIYPWNDSGKTPEEAAHLLEEAAERWVS